ncbi:unnamed protein product [Soboliphyme baturini]|uniref:PAP-associated domain-containing protein n=1 Tax=Soboliphyme baturini TaxID=241478 RepID=A0A183ICK1_9BILA|nr:unnamed protein product [Soboliphyme baturini]
MASRCLLSPFRTDSDSVADWYLRGRCCTATPSAGRGDEQVLIANFSQSASVTQQPARPLVTRATVERLEDQIYELYERTKLSEVGLKIRFFLASAIEEIFRPFFPSAICKPFGSSVNGFGRRGCDLDVDIQLYNEPYLDVHATKSNGQFFYCCKQKPKESRHFVQNTLSTIGDVLNEFMPCYGDVQKILRARVPIIKFNHGIFGLSCDMTVENKSGYKAAKALWNVCQLHPSIGPMLFFIRHWAKEVGITHETPGIWLTNFQIICLLIFFLQRHSPSLLPSLDRLEKRMTLPPSSPSPEVFQLIQEFFYFYAHQVDYRKYGLDLNTGTLVEKKDSSLLYIRNPYESGHNITRNLSSDEWLNTLLSMDTALRLCEKADAMCRRRGSRNGDWGLLTLCNPVFYQERKKPSIASAAEEVAQSFSVEDVLSPDATETATAVPTNASSRIAASMNNLQKANLC